LRVIELVRTHVPQVPVIVRTRDDHDMALLKQAGAKEVVPDAFEVSLGLATHTLNLMGLPAERVNRLVASERASQYAGLK
jgi:CPA2 family monovalent cation:H+ antiporter-2